LKLIQYIISMERRGYMGGSSGGYSKGGFDVAFVLVLFILLAIVIAF